MRHQINLADPALLPPKPFFQFNTMVMALALVIVALLGCTAFIQHGLGAYEAVAEAAGDRLAQRQAQLDVRSKNQKPAQKDPALAAELERAQGALGRTEQILESLRAGQGAGRSGAAALEALSAAAMPQVWLTRISLQPGGLSLSGLALKAEALPSYLDRLHAQQAFQGLRFGSFELTSSAVSARKDGASAPLGFRLDSVREEKSR